MTDNPVVQIPHSPNAEKSVIGSLLIDPEAIKDLNLAPEAFYLEVHRIIYGALLDMRRAAQPVDMTTLCSHLSSAGKLAEVGGPAYIMGLMASTPTSLHVKAYADIVRKMAKRRGVLDEARNLTMAAFDCDSDLDAAISLAMDHLSKTSATRAGAVHISEIVADVYDQVEKAMDNPRDVFGIPTGFDDWDKLTYGLQPGTVIKITGEPGIGKSLLAVQILANAAQKGHPAGLYELEMRRGNVVRRLLSGMSKIPTFQMQQGKISDEGWEAFTEAVETLAALPVYIEANSQLTTGDIRSDLYRLKQAHGVEVAVIDYEDLLKDVVPGANENQLSAIRSARVHDIAVDLDIALVVLDDMVKAGMRGEIEGQTALAGSGKKMHDADEIIIMRRAKENSRIVTLTWEKNREGNAKRFIQLYQQENYPAFSAYTQGRKS
jgi:replicative DNA helicase